MSETFKGFSKVVQRSESQAQRQREASRSRSSYGPVRNRKRFPPSRDPYDNLSNYGTPSFPDTSKQLRADGSIVYYRDNQIVKEFSASGKQIVRVGVSKKSPGSSGRISKITAPVMLQQRYREALTRYNTQLENLQRQRRQEIFRRVIRDSTYTGVMAKNLLGKVRTDALTGPYSDSYKERLKKELDLRLAAELTVVSNLQKRLSKSLSGTQKLSDRDYKKLQKIQAKVARVERVRAEVAAKRDETVSKITGKSSIKGDGYLARAARQLPAQAFSTFYNLAPSLYKTVLEVDSFFSLLRASPDLIDKSGLRQESVLNFKKTGRAIIEAYDPRNPENLFNIFLTATAITSLGAAKATKASFSKQMRGAKIKDGKVTIRGPKTGKTTTYMVTGRLQLPSIKFLGRVVKGKTVPFRSLQTITRGVKNSANFRNVGVTRYLLRKATNTLSGLKIKKVFTNIEKKTTFKSKGKSVKIPGTKKFLLKEKAVLKSGLRRLSAKTRSVVGKKKVTSLTKKDLAGLLTRLKKVQNSKEVVRLKFESSYASIPPRTMIGVAKRVIAGVTKKISVKSAKSVLSAAKKNAANLRQFMKQYYKARKSLFKDKRGELSIGRDPSPMTRSLDRDFTKIDSLLKKVEQLEKARVTPIAKRAVSVRSSVVGKTKFFNPGTIFSGYQLIARPLLLSRYVSLIPVLGIMSSKGLVVSTSTPVSPSIPQGIVEPLAPSRPVPKSGTESSSIPKPGKSYSPPAPPSPVIIAGNPLIVPRWFPFAGGLPIPSVGGAGSAYNVPLSRFLRLESYKYSADLYSKLYGLKASKSDRANLLRAGRVFTGLELRKII